MGAEERVVKKVVNQVERVEEKGEIWDQYLKMLICLMEPIRMQNTNSSIVNFTHHPKKERVVKKVANQVERVVEKGEIWQMIKTLNMNSLIANFTHLQRKERAEVENQVEKDNKLRPYTR